MDVQQMCRLCFFKLHEPKNIFTTPGLLDKISKFTDIQIRQGDGLPINICDLCNVKLQITDKFRHQIEKADKLIRACVSEQTIESNDSRRSAVFEKATPTRNNAPKWFEDNFRSHSTRRRGIRRERMRLSKKRPWSMNLLKNYKSCEGALIYSYATAKSLVASYKALINRCRTNGCLEEFSLPSSIAVSDNESEEENVNDPRAVSSAAARQRFLKKRNEHKKSPQSITTSVISEEIEKQISRKVSDDPLNLLKVKCVRPLVDEDSSSREDRLTCRRSEYKRYGEPGYKGFGEDLEDHSSSECSSSEKNFSEEYWRSPSSASSKSTVLTNEHQSSRDAGISPSNKNAGVDDVDEEEAAVKNRQSPAQCPLCDKICPTIRGLKAHFWVHRSARCKICDAPTGSKEKFRDHVFLHVKPLESDVLFKCEVCTNIFKTDIGLMAHMRNHSKSVPVPNKCSHCGRTFASLRGCRIHMAKAHSGFVTE